MSFGESVVRIDAAKPSALKATDFFTPYDADTLDNADLDLGTGSPVPLPDSMGTTRYPHLLVQVGKEGYVYLLDRDNLGGVDQGRGGGDAVVDKVGPFGGAWSTPGIWPGNGGYVYITTATGGSRSLGNANQGDFNVFKVVDVHGVPKLRLVAIAPQPFGFGSSSPIITSNQETSGSAVVWAIRTVSGDGDQAELQAYQPVPAGDQGGPATGRLPLIAQWPVGTATKFNSPGVYDNHLYVGTADGHVLGFGLRGNPSLSGTGVDFGSTPIGTSVTKTVTVTAHTSMRILDVHSETRQFAVGATDPAPGPDGQIALSSGQSLQIQVTFSPRAAQGVGGREDTLLVQSSAGELDLALSGSAVARGPQLWASTKGLDLGGIYLGQQSNATVTFRNFGTAPLVIGQVTAPVAPFVLSGAPDPGTSIKPGATFTVTVSVTATSPGPLAGSFSILSSGGNLAVALSAVAAAPPDLVITPTPTKGVISLGSVPVGSATSTTVELSNDGGSTLDVADIESSGSSAFVTNAQTQQSSDIPAGESEPFQVFFQPQADGTVSDTVTVSIAGSTVPTDFTLTGTGTGPGTALPPPSTKAGWQVNGSASDKDGTATLTPLATGQAGSTWWPVPQATSTLAVSYTVNAQNGDGADGSALVLANADDTSVTALGGDGGSLGFEGIDGVAVVTGEYQEPGAPGEYYVGIADTKAKVEVAGTSEIDWLATAQTPNPTQDNPTNITVTVTDGVLTVYADGQSLLSTHVDLPPAALVGFTGSTGGLDNIHSVSDVVATFGGVLASTVPTTPAQVTIPSTPIGSATTSTVPIDNTLGWGVDVTGYTVSNPDFSLPGLSTPTELPADVTTQLPIVFQPTTSGTETGTLTISYAGGASSVIDLSGEATGTTVTPIGLTAGAWRLNGTATLANGILQLTPVGESIAGSAYLKAIDPSSTTAVTFSAFAGGGGGADGTALIFASPSTRASQIGQDGSNFGFVPAPEPAYAVVVSEYPEVGAPGANFVGITDGTSATYGHSTGLRWLRTTLLPHPLSTGPDVITVTTTASSITVAVDGIVELEQTGLSLPTSMRIGFSAGSGEIDDVHSVSNVRITEG